MARIGESGDLLKCSFCGKSQKQVKKLIAGPGVYICDECIDLCNEIIDEELTAPPTFDIENLPKPREIYDVLDEYVVGQQDAREQGLGRADPRRDVGVGGLVLGGEGLRIGLEGEPAADHLDALGRFAGRGDVDGQQGAPARVRLEGRRGASTLRGDLSCLTQHALVDESGWSGPDAAPMQAIASRAIKVTVVADRLLADAGTLDAPTAITFLVPHEADPTFDVGGFGRRPRRNDDGGGIVRRVLDCLVEWCAGLDPLERVGEDVPGEVVPAAGERDVDFLAHASVELRRPPGTGTDRKSPATSALAGRCCAPMIIESGSAASIARLTDVSGGGRTLPSDSNSTRPPITRPGWASTTRFSTSVRPTLTGTSAQMSATLGTVPRAPEAAPRRSSSV